jgi:polyhydroxybutyrate depolymerase
MELEGRTFQIHLPAASPSPRPLLLAFHGGLADGAAMRRLTNLDARADREGWVVAYPDGVEGHWNDGRGTTVIPAHRDDVDDVGLAAALVDHLAATAGVDRDRVYATGFSNGAMFCHRLASERPGLVAAIAPVAGTMPVPLLDAERPRPVPVLIVHGTADPVVAYEGGPVMADPARGRVASVEQTAARWRAANRCRPEPAVEDLPHRDPSDATRIRVATWRPIDDDGADVVVATVDGGGHTWPGGLQYQPQRVIGPVAGDVHASDLIAAFCRGRARRP